MNKNTILELSNDTFDKIMDFGKYYKNENLLETSFANWNVRDVIGHVNSWIKFSEDKLESIKLKRSFEDVRHVDIDKFNEMNYEKNKTKTLEDVLHETKIILNNYNNILNLFNEEELLSKEFPTGFSFELWKYMAMDVYIHPIAHILYHYIKREDYNKFIIEIENSKNVFMEYPNNINVYDFGDFFENREEKVKRFNGLKNIIKNKGNKFVEEIIEINSK
ncbi:hypothetical protein FACS1894172_04850 [Spirochaetia bacterium]|nr:hypothetical protein FACS1894164_05550 [Spirochaetia bacterium]GHU30875.1 hypothetical protein FACS1894172_04850 [Spirochaetia bacterium]